MPSVSRRSHYWESLKVQSKLLGEPRLEFCSANFGLAPKLPTQREKKDARYRVVGESTVVHHNCEMPDPENDENNRSKPKRDPYDWLLLTVLSLTLIAAITAATANSWQAYIARDQEHRTLRAYVMVKAAIEGKPDEGDTIWTRLDAKSIGQTPVYNFDYFVFPQILHHLDEMSEPGLMHVDCSYVTSHQNYRGATFSDSFQRAFGYSKAGHSRELDSLNLGEGSRLLTYGTACYRDVFGSAHYVRICFEWRPTDKDPSPCFEERPDQD